MRHRPGSGRGSMNRVCTGCNLVGSRRNQVGRLGSHRHPATSTDLVVALPIRSTWAAVPPDSSCPRRRRLLRPGDRRRHSHSAQCTQPSIRQIPLAAALGDRRTARTHRSSLISTSGAPLRELCGACALCSTREQGKVSGQSPYFAALGKQGWRPGL